MPENPGSTSGAIAALRFMNKYVPTIEGGRVKKVATNGDQGSVERHIGAQRHLAGSKGLASRLVGLEPTPQEFHKRGVYLQVKDCSLHDTV